ncbi:LPXTG cell wall anchor domain-containing protein [Streptomyces sp. NPDC004539]|uniref:LPXTG cell wall anchor domain-containing protein n=1 Tax=Streptomyces sp. NPDC004539 TaxID=3154280 RepID=UPI0033B934E7
MSSARRPLLTATAAGTLLCALWFVPSAKADTVQEASTPSQSASQQARAVPLSDSSGAELADTGSFDTTPYVVGGSLFLTLGAGFVLYSVRRERLDF